AMTTSSALDSTSSPARASSPLATSLYRMSSAQNPPTHVPAPVQQSALVVQRSFFCEQLCSGGGTQRPFRQKPVQQSMPVSQVPRSVADGSSAKKGLEFEPWISWPGM